MPFEAGYRPGLPRSLCLIVEIGVLLGLLVGCGGETATVVVDTGSSIVAVDGLGGDSEEDAASIQDVAPHTDATGNPDLLMDSVCLADEVSPSDWVSGPEEAFLLDWDPQSDTEPEVWSQDTSGDGWDYVSGDAGDVVPDGICGCVDKDPEPWSRKIMGAGGVVVFTEVLYEPADGASPAWVELYNPFSIDMDISGWQISGDVTYLFPDDTFMPPGGYLVVASDPAALGLIAGAEALGPWSGILPLWYGKIELRSNTDRLMDVVEWTAGYPWPVTAAGSGASLSKMNPVSRSEEAEGWQGSWAPGGSPAEANFPEDVVPADDPGLRFSEVSAGGGTFWVELVNSKEVPSDLADLVLATSTGAEVTLSPWSLMPGEIALLTLDELGFSPEPGELLFLFSPGKELVLDGVTITNDPRAREEEGGAWYFPEPPTPGESNAPQVPGTVVINEIMYHHAPFSDTDGSPLTSTEEWLEL